MRRIVTGLGADGRSTVLEDGPPRTVFHFGRADDPHAAAPANVDTVPSELAENSALLAELWIADGRKPLPTDDPTEGASWDVELPPGMTGFRIARYGPNLFAPLHRTNTLDYDVVLDGSVTLLLEDGREVTMGPGDAVVIPGILHGWRAGAEGCTKAIAMTGLSADGTGEG